MGDMAEDRVYGDDGGTTEVIIAAGIGIVSVSVSGDRIGRFGVTQRCSPRDVAAADGLLAVATEENVLLRREGTFAPTGFGPAVAVGVGDGGLLAADGDARIARRGYDGDTWSTVGIVDGDVLAIDDALLATDAGVYRVHGEGEDASIRPAELEAANDVAARGPFAATDAGLYALGNGWVRAIDGRFDVVAAASREHACAAGKAFYERNGGDWRVVDPPTDDPVVGVAVGKRTYVITEGGALLVGPEWRSRSLGVDGVAGIAVV
jgi:hypothetical protein